MEESEAPPEPPKEKEGALVCKLDGEKAWTERYFIYRNGALAVYKDLKKRQKKEQSPLNTIDVRGAVCEFARQNPTTKMWGFTLVTKAKQECWFVAEDKGYANSWIDCLDPGWKKRAKGGKAEFKDAYIRACLDLEDQPDSADKTDKALAIYNEYFEPGADNEIPELAKHRQKVLTELRSGVYTTFFQASSEFRSMYMAAALQTSSPIGTCEKCKTQLQYSAKGGKVACYKCQHVNTFPAKK